MRESVLGVESLHLLEEAIVRCNDDDAQSVISDEYRMLTGEAELCESCDRVISVWDTQDGDSEGRDLWRLFGEGGIMVRDMKKVMKNAY